MAVSDISNKPNLPTPNIYNDVDFTWAFILAFLSNIWLPNVVAKR